MSGRRDASARFQGISGPRASDCGGGDTKGVRGRTAFGAGVHGEGGPDLEDHEVVFRLLPAERDLGIVLTSAYQLVPEQSTAAIIVHHPQAKYYAVRG